jgi:enoyl-CoA hydratase
MEYSRIIYEPGSVTRIKLNRPRFLNGISHPMYREMEDAFDRAGNDKDCHCIVLSGEGRCFSAGHDHQSPEAEPVLAKGGTKEELLKEYGSEDALEAAWWKEHYYFTQELKAKWRYNPKPTIAMVHGYCHLGAYATAACMDIIFASEDALFLPAAMGVYDAAPWWFGVRKYKELVFEGRYLPAREALACGFVNRVFANQQVLEKETLAYAERVADNYSEDSLPLYKRYINYAQDMQGVPMAVAAGLDLYKLQQRMKTSTGLVVLTGKKAKTGAQRAMDNLKAMREAEKASQAILIQAAQQVATQTPALKADT